MGKSPYLHIGIPIFKYTEFRSIKWAIEHPQISGYVIRHLEYIINRFRIMTTDKKKRGGRPSREHEAVTLSLRLDTDLYQWIVSGKGRTSINQFINDITRKEARL